ncbi:MAG: radical SAM family heme chaperone HemW [Acidobacteriota bacterium]|nr:radical SAM family heme chaperone HemW [Acidobacteriota bacterium]
MTERKANANVGLGVYVSVPFCRAKCSFCNFASGVASTERIAGYVDTLCAEIDAATVIAARLAAELPAVVDTIYFGGGTPSLLAPAQMQAVFAALRRNFDVRPDAEITMEAAPGQIADAALEEAMRRGVNRVSLGVQSFVDRESAAVGRTHTGVSCLAEIARLRTAGLKEVAADLIAGLPYQTAESWQYSLEAAVDAGLTHVSVYMLEVDEDSRLGREVIAGGVRFHAHGVPSDEISAELYEQACGFLEAHGFPQYEISNFAMGEHESRHNRKYWERAPYFGFGLDAHSMLPADGGAVRFANPDEMRDYGAAAWGGKVVRMGMDEAFEESLFLGLRMNFGVPVVELETQFGHERVDACGEAVRELIEGGLMDSSDGRWRLTLRGRMVSNEVFGRLLEGVVA